MHLIVNLSHAILTNGVPDSRGMILGLSGSGQQTVVDRLLDRIQADPYQTSSCRERLAASYAPTRRMDVDCQSLSPILTGWWG